MIKSIAVATCAAIPGLLLSSCGSISFDEPSPRPTVETNSLGSVSSLDQGVSAGISDTPATAGPSSRTASSESKKKIPA